MGRSPCCSKVGLRRGPWSTKEDSLLTNFIQLNGEGQWRALPKKAGLLRCGKSCRLRWMNYLRPGIKRGNITEDEEDLIVRLHGLLGNRWSLIAGRLPGRTDNEIKNYWNTHLLKKLKTAGFQPRLQNELPKLENPPAAGKNRKKEKGYSPEKTKAYLPKAIRVAVMPRTESDASLVSGTSSSDGFWEKSAAATAVAEVESYAPMTQWPPSVFDVFSSGAGEDGENVFLGGGYVLPVIDRGELIAGDVEMMENVYDEYLQLLEGM